MRNKRKLLSLIMTVAMITTLFAGLTISASATTDVWDGSVATGFASGDGSDGNPYIIKTGAQLAYLATQVNSGNSYSGYYFKLDDDINLNGSSSGNAWSPIGGQIHENSSYVPIPTTKYFAGNFEGNNCTIEGLYINTSVTTGSSGNFAGWGLFGCASGPVKNLTVKGSIILSGSAEYVGGVVGYTTSDVYNCHTEVTIAATSASNVGGVVGAIERTETSELTSPFKVQACSAKNNISAGKRVGGVVGGVYCKYAGNVRVDNCYFASGTSTPVTFTVNSGKAWSGSVVGYNKGYISNCYAVATLISGGGRYICGVAGVLNGSSPQAKLENSYAAVNFSGCSTSYDRPLFGSCDYSNTLEINNCLYDFTKSGSYTNPSGDGSNGWGKWTSSGYATTANLQSSTGTATVFTSPSTTAGSACVSTVLGSAYTVGSNNYNNNYPYLKWQASASNLPDYTPGSTTTSTLPSTVFVDGVSGSNTNGGTSSTNAFKTLDKAINNVASGGTIKVVDTVTLNGDYNFTPTLNIKRDGTGAFPLFEIAGGTVKFSTMTVSGEGYGTLFSVTGGTLYLRGGITLNNCATAVNVGSSGTLTVNYAKLTGDTNSIVNAGTLVIDDYGGTIISGTISNSGTATMNGGTISGFTTSGNGGGLNLTGGTFTMSGGTISGNTAANGGGVYLSGGNFTMSGGTITGNTAYNGAGVYVYSGTFTMTGGSIAGNSASNKGSGVYYMRDIILYTASGISLTDSLYSPNQYWIQIHGNMSSLASALIVDCSSFSRYDIIINLGYYGAPDLSKVTVINSNYTPYLEAQGESIAIE